MGKGRSILPPKRSRYFLPKFKVGKKDLSLLEEKPMKCYRNEINLKIRLEHFSCVCKCEAISNFKKIKLCKHEENLCCS